MHLRADVRCAIWYEANVLISGGTAEARRAAAELIHRYTHPAGGLFVTIGSTGKGARAQLCRLLRQAPAHATVFVEEVAAFDDAMQTRLLQLVQSGIEGALRVITATGVDLFERVRSSRFSSDLFYRLNVIHLALDLAPVEAYG